MSWRQIRWLAPRSTREVLSRQGEPQHLLLRFYQYLPAELIEEREGKQRVLDALARSAPGMLDSALLKEMADRQSRLVAELKNRGYRVVAPNRLRLESNLTCGLATPNLVERGMTLSRPYGLPIVPASGVKGAIAAYLAEVLEDKLHLTEAEQHRALARANLALLFGEAARGEARSRPAGAIFFDALPEAAPLCVDVTTPHYARYYQGKETAATGFESPVPLPFLTVKAGAIFLFLILVAPKVQWTPPAADDQRRLHAFGITRFDSPEGFLADALASTACYKGFGAQTNVGYGRFVRFTVSRS
jgi:CRISPR-associated protein Cmr6